ncbi:aminotransferase class I/II-fold pyridoxal phosphate-dependent enzyme [Sphingobacterium sp. SRCM116780]|uniref:aminotransferase class I/II-fold pyridoxal phosphate-dependent enzyme n=1 Tax=Sphingobacterium sp. SRCM116780 TaxID=2907623 RepID=UPI001F182C13|nr:aminotransferase class I/II-fold pyridoxal phosphate-dependent enzyme [Sphingobacterium sp. SRCM116780]UIR55803.1 aminotransferase class I/II-fold pyridoxal phosphate-dependent enzyme [Sphingobacterium sp. SRCM116780]
MKDFTQLQQPTGRIIHTKGQDYLFFGGTAYLGLLVNPKYLDLYMEGIRTYGLNNGTSRNNNIQLDIFDIAEKTAAKRFGFEDAMMISSGYLAAQLAVKSLSSFGELLYAPNCHPALWLDKNPDVNGNHELWLKEIVLKINSSDQDSFVIVSNALDNLTPSHYDFKELLAIDSHKKIVLLLDDSHGIGIVRENQVSADVSIFEQTHIEVVVLASMAKGLGIDAGIILSSNKYMRQMRKSPFFTGASPASPAGLHAFTYGEKVYLDQFEKLQHNIQLFSSLIGNRVKHIDHFPVFTSEDPKLYQQLEQNGFLISSFPYPLETDPPLNRIVLSSLHVSDDLKKLAEVIND